MRYIPNEVFLIKCTAFAKRSKFQLLYSSNTIEYKPSLEALSHADECFAGKFDEISTLFRNCKKESMHY